MPLKHSKSKQAFQNNLKAELGAGKLKAQALAIAYSVKRAAGHYIGGPIKNMKSHPKLVEMARKRLKMMSQGGTVDEDVLDPDDEIFGHGPDEAELGMNDTYPRFNNEESDTMGQDSEDLDYEPHQAAMPEDQEEARKMILRGRARKMLKG